jgi:acyl transferase domain-containing protein
VTGRVSKSSGRIAIVGHGAILPGANDPDRFWARLVAGRSAATVVPDGRWLRPAHELRSRPGETTLDRVTSTTVCPL